ncbi:hypothetical protein [Luteolibacter marinus]|uniref:hypothetical protein n=1 Tax=Luteolibacter marinus TaxID=2776705 RepID=UPI0018686C02|nr:hypothetical protein [Luteolibacter marinus]
MKTLYWIPVTGLALAAGWAGGRMTSPSRDDGEPGKQEIVVSKTARDRREAKISTPAVQSFAQLLQSRGSDRRILGALSRQLDDCGEAELEEMLKVLKDSDPYGAWGNRYVAMGMIFERWAELGPDQAMAAAMKLDPWETSQAFGAIFATVAADDPAAAWQLASSVPEGAMRKMAHESALEQIAKDDPLAAYARFKETPGLQPYGLFNAWAKTDPAGALAAGRTLPGTNRNEVVGRVFRQWFRDDQGVALEEYAKLGGLERRAAGEAILGVWAARDAAAAADWAVEHRTELSDNSLMVLCNELGKIDPMNALSWATDHLSENVRVGAMENIFSEWVMKTPADAIGWLKSIEDPAEKVKIINRSFWQLAWSDSDLAVSLAKDIGEQNFDSWYVQEIGNNLAGLDLQKALAIADGFETDSFRNQMKDGIVAAWTQVDPEAALAFAMAETNESDRAMLLGTIVAGMTERDPQKAMTLAEGLPAGKEKTQAISSVVASWAEKSPLDASAYVKGLTDPVLRDAAVEALMGRWCWTDGEAAMKFAATMENSAALETGAARAASSWAKRDPQAAYDYALSLPDSGVSKKAGEAALNAWAREKPADAAAALAAGSGGSADAYQAVAGAWVEKDRGAALGWAEGLSADPSAQAGAFEAIAASWSKTDPGAAGSWLQGLAEGEPRDKAVMAYSKQMLSSDPAVSMGWAISISDESRRWDTVKSLAKTWHDRDAAAAVDWMAAQGYGEADIREATRD